MPYNISVERRKNMTIQNRLKKLRKALNLNQTDFGNEIGISQITISNWESAKYELTYKSALLICDKFNVNIDWLMNGNGDMFKCTNQEVIDNLNQRLDGLSEAEIEFLRKWLQLSYEERVYIFDKIKFLFGDVWAKKNTD